MQKKKQQTIFFEIGKLWDLLTEEIYDIYICCVIKNTSTGIYSEYFLSFRFSTHVFLKSRTLRVVLSVVPTFSLKTCDIECLYLEIPFSSSLE